MLRLTLLTSVFLFFDVGTARATGVIGGRIVVRDGDRVIGADDLQRSPPAPIRIDFRSGRQVLSVEPDPFGLFSLAGPEGTYRFEYLEVGGVAEFFAPRETDIRDSVLTCIGTLEVVLPDPRTFGTNADSTLRVIDDCAQIGPALRQQNGWKGELRSAIAIVGEPLRERPSLVDLLVGARVETGWNRQQLATLGGSLVYPFRGSLLSHSSWTACFSGGRFEALTTDGAKAAPYGSAGAGYSFRFLELAAQGGYLARRNELSGGWFGAVSARLDIVFLGLGLRLHYFPGTGKTTTIGVLDLSPVGLLGMLL